MSTPSPVADRNLIFGLLALQMDFVTREQLLDAMHAWMLDKQTPLGEILCRRGVLADDDRSCSRRWLVREAPRAGTATRKPAWPRCASSRPFAATWGSSTIPTCKPASPGCRPQDSPATATASRKTPLPACPRPHPSETLPAPTRFRRLREHAKGGLGEVFVALDRS